MPTNKDLKRLVRARMQKTGEAYTTARAQLLRKRRSKKTAAPAAAPAPVEPSPTEYAKLAGMSDDAVKAKTGCDWNRWVYALDRVKAHEWAHRRIADYVYEKYKISGWWAQTVTVGYERIKGLREIGQRRGGGYEASKSKTFPVPLAKLYGAWSNAKTRAKWLPGAQLTVRKASRNKAMRITWQDGTSVELWFTAKRKDKSQVAVSHRKLPDKAAADRLKAYWGERLGALGELLK